MRRIGAKHLKRCGAARRKEPLAAAIGVAPPLKMDAFHVGEREQIRLKIVIAGTGAKAFEVRFIAGGQFCLTGLDAAVWAFEG